MVLNLTVMKQTAGNAFLDSNILIYCYTNTEPEKQQKAFQVIDNNSGLFISIQVLQDGHFIENKLTIVNPFT